MNEIITNKKEMGNKRYERKLNIYAATIVVAEFIILILPFCSISETLESEYKLFWIVSNCITLPLYGVYIVKYIHYLKNNFEE